jgi:hypothetical protein
MKGIVLSQAHVYVYISRLRACNLCHIITGNRFMNLEYLFFNKEHFIS